MFRQSKTCSCWVSLDFVTSNFTALNSYLYQSINQFIVVWQLWGWITPKLFSHSLTHWHLTYLHSHNNTCAVEQGVRTKSCNDVICIYIYIYRRQCYKTRPQVFQQISCYTSDSIRPHRSWSRLIVRMWMQRICSRPSQSHTPISTLISNQPECHENHKYLWQVRLHWWC